VTGPWEPVGETIDYFINLVYISNPYIHTGIKSHLSVDTLLGEPKAPRNTLYAGKARIDLKESH